MRGSRLTGPLLAAHIASLLWACTSAPRIDQNSGAADSNTSEPRSISEARPDSSVFVVWRGHDTTRVEWAIRHGNRLQVTAITRASPEPTIMHYDVQLGGDGAIERMEVFDVSALGASPQIKPRALLYAKGDSTIELRLVGQLPRLATAGRTHVYNSGAVIPFLFSILPPLVSRVTEVGDSVVLQHVPGTLGPRPYLVRRVSPDRVLTGSQRTGMIRLELNRDKVQRIDAMASSFNVIGERNPWLNMDSVFQALVQMERLRPQGPVAPRDSAVLAFGEHKVAIDYGRPAKRGREIFGGIVPYDRIWRTGANAATHIRAERDLDFGSVTIPAGEYTLWTLPSAASWLLIFNRQTGQWGTDYDAAYDVARIPLTVRPLSEPVERFTIVLEPTGDRTARLKLLWDRTEAAASFTVR